ncbi:hypothetical protein DUI87_33998 [Hirundo rustica rustica]|uniref:Zinc finger protein 541 n=1 Tax=Hirundo rustica rustica TaxID=333673 RepID=A0A3M0ISY5_HIRRU|nr:hypothetical protein DUI87_33998 [Hirundo rustica rustica]
MKREMIWIHLEAIKGLPGKDRVLQRHINVGSEFQAELPELQSRAPSEDEEPASLVWKPWGEDDSDMQKPDRVRELLDMASSRGVPRAEAKLELALHCLHQARGSVPEALEMLLSGGPPTAPGHPLADYHYADSDRWTPEEKESFEKALHSYGKDFHLIQKQIQSKTVAQCVEYYYCSWKKERKLASAAAQSVGKAERSKSPGRKENGERGKRSRKRPRKAECPCCPAPQPPRSAPGPFACRQCKRAEAQRQAGMITRILRDPSPEHNPRITECSGLEGTHNTIESGPWHINVGSEFQAELPELQSRAPSEDEEPASLVWKPWGKMTLTCKNLTEPDCGRVFAVLAVRELLDMASSRGVPRAEAKLELALHCLHQARGSVPEALEMLLSGGPPTAPGHPLADYHYADSDRWTPEEKESFEKALHTYGKDFHLIQKQIQSKTVAQCVDYWKKERKLASAAAQHQKIRAATSSSSHLQPHSIPTALWDCQRHINVGSEFQAELPELQSRAPSEDEEPASLVWKPWGEDDSDMQKPDRVRELLDMASSRGVPRAEAKLELALHCLHQARGSVPEALEMLLSGGPPTAPGHPLADYHYADSDRWTPEEKESFEKALHTYGKDFHLIQKQIQSKTVAQCVDLEERTETCQRCCSAPEDPNPAATSSSPHLQPHSIPTALWDCQRHINVGSEFQAELPELQSRAPSEDEEPASLVWKPWGEDDSDMQKPDRVRELLDMASSRGVPRAEAKLELALHCLHQARGSVPEALEMLLSGGPPTAPGHPLADYHYADSDRWTPEEKETFEKALHTYGKDFHLIQKQIQSKIVAQCVEYYYCSWKKERNLASAAAQSVGKAERSKSPGRKENGERGKRSRKRPRKAECPCCPAPQPPPSAPGPFACRQCKRVFESKEERDAHRRRYGRKKGAEPVAKKKRPN